MNYSESGIRPCNLCVRVSVMDWIAMLWILLPGWLRCAPIHALKLCGNAEPAAIPTHNLKERIHAKFRNDQFTEQARALPVEHFQGRRRSCRKMDKSNRWFINPYFGNHRD